MYVCMYVFNCIHTSVYDRMLNTCLNYVLSYFKSLIWLLKPSFFLEKSVFMWSPVAPVPLWSLRLQDFPVRLPRKLIDDLKATAGGIAVPWSLWSRAWEMGRTWKNFMNFGEKLREHRKNWVKRLRPRAWPDLKASEREVIEDGLIYSYVCFSY